MSNMSKNETSKDKYFETLVQEIYEDLGKKIQAFKDTPKSFLQAENITNSNVELIHLLDTVYQAQLDEIFDILSNAGDLKVGTRICNAINQGMLLKRGFLKEQIKNKGK